MTRVSLVLGAGGPVGHAYHAGLLRALADGLGWDPRRARLVVGTSAGAQVGALLRAGMSGEDLSARVTGDEMSAQGDAIAAHWTRPSHDAPAGAEPYRPGSPRYLRSVLRRPWRARPGRLAAALLPEGRVRLDAQVEGLRRLFGAEWSAADLWITAVCLHTGERHAFGRPGSPTTDVGTAVACSGAVPGVCAPPEVEGRPFVDGGMASPTHLDLVEDTEDDIVIVSSPLSMIPPMRLLLAAELRRLRASGKRIVVFEPRGEASATMGLDPMDLERAPEVARAAHRVTLRELDTPRLHEALSDLRSG